MSQSLSKTRIDRAGDALARDRYRTDDEYLEADDILDRYRESHLLPLSETTSAVQGWLAHYGEPYYIAQRLKRKPQIIRKLRRLPVRLSQLQDIGGLRVIVPKSNDVDQLLRFLLEHIQDGSSIAVERVTDYRERGRDRTGYRALHVILKRDGKALELQLRSRAQHYWAESIERVSIIYGYHLKEEEGEPEVLGYFQALSEAFYELELGRTPGPELRLRIDAAQAGAEAIIRESPRGATLDSRVDEGVIRAISDERRPRGITNWIIVFDWNSGGFVHWKAVPQDPRGAMREYSSHEALFRSEDGFEVVLVGASEPATLKQTHSHYFGLEKYDHVLETLEMSIEGFSRRLELGLGARQILLALHRKHKWGTSRVSRDTLKNHFCANVVDFDDSIESLVARGLVTEKGGYSLNQTKKADVESYI